jgi:hypothetical protein
MVSSLSEIERGRASVRWLVDAGLDVEVIVRVVRRAAHSISGANKWKKGRHYGRMRKGETGITPAAAGMSFRWLVPCIDWK